MNVVFISPQFPEHFHNFCERLKSRGVRVLGIGDSPYESLSIQMKSSLTEYYLVDSLEDYESVYRACSYFIWHYGQIDWIESQNEYWLELEATLRNDFNVITGPKIQDLSYMKYKSKMKEIYKKIDIPTARFRFVDDYQAVKSFANKVGYPVVVKPDNGVGASSTYKLKNDDELDYFFSTKNPQVQFIVEELVPGHVETFDGISDKDKNIIIATSHVMLNSIMDTVNEKGSVAFYSQPVEDLDLYEIGKKTVDAFEAKSRFFHFEFFRLDEDKEGLGQKGDIVGLEVNMRAPGAYIPEMMNLAYDVDVYTVWADMLQYNECYFDIDRKHWVGYAGRRNEVCYKRSYEEIRSMYSDQIQIETDVPFVLAPAMTDHVFIFIADSREDILGIIQNILE